MPLVEVVDAGSSVAAATAAVVDTVGVLELRASVMSGLCAANSAGCVRKERSVCDRAAGRASAGDGDTGAVDLLPVLPARRLALLEGSRGSRPAALDGGGRLRSSNCPVELIDLEWGRCRLSDRLPLSEVGGRDSEVPISVGRD